VIDNCVLPGDASIEIAKDLPKAAPLSTVVCCSILQSIVAEVAVRMHQDGFTPPIFTSANVPEGDATLAKNRINFGGGRPAGELMEKTRDVCKAGQRIEFNLEFSNSVK